MRHKKSMGDETKTKDLHVGASIKQRRLELGLSQSELAELIGVTYQQVDKYERGTNRVAAGRLWQIAMALSVDPNYFFQGMDGDEKHPSHREAQRRIRELVRRFRVAPTSVQNGILQLLRALAEDPTAQ